MKISRLLASLLVGVMIALFAGCGGDDDGDKATTPEATPTTTETTAPAAQDKTTSTVSMDEYSFDPEDVVVKRGATLSVANEGAIAHNLTIEQGPDGKEKTKKLAGTSTFLPDKKETLKIDLSPGEYGMVCTVPGHRELGMVGTARVK